jgi:hypothetical protein
LEDIFVEWGISMITGFKNSTGINQMATASYFAITPNPVTTEANLTWNMTTPGHVSIVLLDNQGRQIAEPVNSYFAKGQCSATISTQNLQPGIYFCRLTTAEKVMMKKIVVVR